MPTVTVEYFGMDGRGKNLTEAKQDAGRKIEKLLREDFVPVLMSYRMLSVLIYRTPTGLHTTNWVDPATGAFQEDKLFRGGFCPGSTMKDLLHETRMHLAEQGWTPDDGTEPPAFLEDERQQAEFRGWAQWQLRYRYAKKNGLNDNDAHSWAGKNPARSDLLERLPEPTTV